jgi:uridine phosphorylase
MPHARYPILDHDPERPAVIEPSEVLSPIDIAEHCVLCFFGDVVRDLAARDDARLVFECGSEMGAHPIFELDTDRGRAAFAQPGSGAPLSAAILEELIALGCRKFTVCGGTGVLDGSVPMGHPVLVTSAARDEGTSYHYLPPDAVARPDAGAYAALADALGREAWSYIEGKTWTTDGVYRETKSRLRRRAAEGCVTVEMEAAALFAVAEFRGVALGQVLYAGDDVGGEQWDSREWQVARSVRERLFWVAVDACLAL